MDISASSLVNVKLHTTIAVCKITLFFLITQEKGMIFLRLTEKNKKNA